MHLPAGKHYKDGVIIGRNPDAATIRGLTPTKLFNPVAEVLERHHGICRQVDYSTYSSHGPFRRHKQSPAITAQSTGYGLVLRIFCGAGSVKVEGVVVDQDAGYGDWLYIPPGVKCTITCNVTVGLNLQFAVAELKPKS